MNDLRFAIRQLAKSPAFTLVSTLTVALGIGASAAIFSVVNGVLLRPLPFPEPDRLVTIREITPTQAKELPVSPGKYFAWSEQARTFESLGALTSATYNLTGRGDPVRVTAMRMTASTLTTFRIQPLFGRSFTREEDTPGRDGVAILSYGLWQRRFGGRPQILGEIIKLNGRPVTIIGVMPRVSPLPDAWELFAPFAPTESNFATFMGHNVHVFGRLRPGATLGEAESELRSIDTQLAKQSPEIRGWSARVRPIMEAEVSEVRPVLIALLGAVAFLLLIACANVANLQMARATGRSRETAVRAALGASRGRLVRQTLVESSILAGLGGALGLLLAELSLDALLALAPEDLIRASEVTVDGRVLLFALVLTALTGIAFGLIPSLQGSRVRLHDALKESGRSVGASGQSVRTRSVLVIAEVATALILLTGAGLLMRSFARLQHEDPGFKPDGAVSAHVHLPHPKYSNREQYLQFANQTMSTLARAPGVEAVAATVNLPFTEYSFAGEFMIAGQSHELGRELPLARLNSVSPRYFEAMGIPLLRGRWFTDADHAGASRVIVVNDVIARKYFPNEDPLGKRIRPVRFGDAWREIIGIVGSVKPDNLQAPSIPELFEPFSVFPDNDIFFVVRTSGSVAALSGAIRTAVATADPELAVAFIRPLSSWVAQSLARERFATLLFMVFSGAALLLAAIGIYGVMAFSVNRRTGEIGVRMALGAHTAEVLRLVLAQGGRLVGLGMLLGILGSLALTRLLSSLLFGISSYDLVTFASVAALILVAGCGACLVPAARATRVNPMTALRME